MYHSIVEGFIGYLFIQTEKGTLQNVSEMLVEKGLASVHFTAERSSRKFAEYK